MCPVDFQLFVKKVVHQSTYFDQNEHGTRMDFTKTPPYDCEVRNMIKFLTAKNKSGAKIHRRLRVVHGEENIMNVQNVQWCQKM